MGEQIDKKSEMEEKEGEDGRTGGDRVGVRTKEMDLKRRGTKQGLVYNGKVQNSHGKMRRVMERCKTVTLNLLPFPI